tara:strand:+ start:7142 stop:8524 length:1383 start_codon:yes stop_codon:yes gene_type:complete
MKNLNKVSFLLVALLILTTSYAQQPDFPSVDEAFAKVNGNSKVLERLKSTYKIIDPSTCKIEKKMYFGGNDLQPSSFATYKTDEAHRLNWRWPDDRAYIVFRVTTSKSEDGTIYELPLVVEYTRLKNKVLTNEWHFHWWKFDDPYSVKGGKEDALFMKLFEKRLSEIEGNLRDRNRKMPDVIAAMTRVGSISKSEVKDVRQFYSNIDHVERTFIIEGDVIFFADHDESVAKENRENVKVYVQTRFSRDKDANGNTGDWYFNEFVGGWGNKIIDGSVTEDKNIYKTVGTHGYNYIKEKGKEQKKVPYYSNRYEGKFQADVLQAFHDFYEQKDGADETLKSYIASEDEEIFNKFDALFSEIREKHVQLRPSGSAHKGILFSVSTDEPNVEDIEATFNLFLTRPAISTDKKLKSIYKTAGMNKSILKKGGGFSKNEYYKLQFTLIDGDLKIASAPVRDYTIEF